MHYDSIVCSTPSEDHFQTEMAFCTENRKLLPDFARLSSHPPPGQWHPLSLRSEMLKQLHSLDKGEKKGVSHLPTAFPHLWGLLLRVFFTIFPCLRHIQLDYSTALGIHYFPLIDLHYLVLSETELPNSWDFLKFSFSRNFCLAFGCKEQG